MDKFLQRGRVLSRKSAQSIEQQIENKWKWVHIPADTRSAFPVISVHSPVSIQCRWQS